MKSLVERFKSVYEQAEERITKVEFRQLKLLCLGNSEKK